MTATELFELRAEETPDVVAIRSLRGEMTFGEWRRRASTVRGLLAEHFGALRGERIALWMTNDDALIYVCAFQAVLDTAAITVALDDRFALKEARRLLREAEPRALLLSPPVSARLGEEGLAELGVRRLDPRATAAEMILLPISGDTASGEPIEWDTADTVNELAPVDARPDDNAMIAYTSGSTGKPKGALWTQSALCQYAERVSHAIYADPRDGKSLDRADVLQSPIPLYTAASIIENLYPTVFSGCKLVYEGGRFDAAASEQRMRANRTTVYNGVPPHYALICELPQPQGSNDPELMVTSGSALTPDLYRRMRARWPATVIANWYGLNESGTGQTLNHGEGMERAPSSIGKPVWPTEVRIASDDGRTLEQGGEGELWMRAPGQMSEYFRNPQQTAERLCDGWLRTGDRATIDGHGLIHIIGRDEERINRGGFKFYPAEIESALEEHDAVREAAVVVVPHPVLGDDPVAFVVPTHDVDEDTLRNHCRKRIAANKVPSRIVFVDELPRGAYGKVVRRELLTRYAGLRPRSSTKENRMTDLGFSIQEIVIASRDVNAAAERFGKALDAPVDAAVSYPQSGIEIDMTGVWVDDFRLAFVQDTSGSGPVSRFLEKRGEGLYELCLRTNDLEAAVRQLKAAGVRFTSEDSHVLKNYEWRGEIFSEVRVAFVHPASASGVLIELQQWVK